MKSIATLREENKNKRALITGFPGQDATYMATLLSFLGYGDIILIARRRTELVEQRIKALENVKRAGTKCEVILYDLSASKEEVSKLIFSTRPDEIYHFAARSHVGDSFKRIAEMSENNIRATQHLLDAIDERVKFYHAGTSEMIGNGSYYMLWPNSPYAIAKTYCHQLVNHYRRAMNYKTLSVVTHNHDSPLRGKNFLIPALMERMDIAKQLGKDEIKVGNLSTERDYSYAGDIVIDIWWLMQMEEQWKESIELGSGVSTSGETIFKKLCEEDYFGISFNPAYTGSYTRPADVYKLEANKERTYRKGHRRMDLAELLDHMFKLKNTNEKEAISFYINYLNEVFSNYEDTTTTETVEQIEE